MNAPKTSDPTTPNAPLAVGEAPDPIDHELAPLLAEPFASVWAAAAGIGPAASASEPVRAREGAGAQAPSAALKGRLMERLAASREAARGMYTARRSRVEPLTVAPGVVERTLYVRDAGRPARPGEPTRVRLIELAPGSTWSGPAAQSNREWLVMRGTVQLGGEVLGLRDYHVDPAGTGAPTVGCTEAAWLFLRESQGPALPGTAGAFTVRDQEAGWPDFAPGLQRRVLWQHAGQAAMLYYAQAGARVPHHTHGHDEECLMVQGDLFLDDVLLREGDYQLAPAGTGHFNTETDTGVVIYAHGDLDLRFVG